MKRRLILLGLLLALTGQAAEVIPSKPTNHFNDYANVTSRGTADELNRTLEDFERATSSQILVAIFPKMQSDSSIEDYTVRIAQSWNVGQKEKSNGAVLFVFTQDRKMFLQVGYGLEGALPDALCKQIIENEIVPRFKRGDYDGGMRAGVQAILAATRGEYKGTGRTQRGKNQDQQGVIALAVFVLVLIVFAYILNRMRGVVYGGRGRRSYYSTWYGGGSGGGGFSGGGGGGGSFSSGGGSFGGGGAGGSW